DPGGVRGRGRPAEVPCSGIRDPGRDGGQRRGANHLLARTSPDHSVDRWKPRGPDQFARATGEGREGDWGVDGAQTGQTSADQPVSGGRAGPVHPFVVASRRLAPGVHPGGGVRTARSRVSRPAVVPSAHLELPGPGPAQPEAIEQAMKLLSWRVYAANQPTAALGLAGAVEAYRDEDLVERTFG